MLVKVLRGVRKCLKVVQSNVYPTALRSLPWKKVRKTHMTTLNIYYSTYCCVIERFGCLSMSCLSISQKSTFYMGELLWNLWDSVSDCTWFFLSRKTETVLSTRAMSSLLEFFLFFLLSVVWFDCVSCFS